MRNLIVVMIGISIFGLSGCLSINSERAPETERIIVVPDDNEKKVKVVP
ncbi:hypothetical protein SAMN05421510_11012 [Nitrosomonas ureae]|uniref:Lipoprotein n=1 Tax=Nitrosomonas ureae TaxID=44577 RepID=A0A1H9HCP9_9PROT|nr:hypothetical protein C8R28_10703 [Nitrosomonas ureae]PXX06714.1 hypothetical protein C8R27_1604 [Nitrosomonas ureae]SDU35411.1 hypothetical protein SAMN05216406_16510 [Nitrosomonas ureae]SEQ60105.1 hypothetical protein SAMN05421510_11012 [Nitrosomonas ureae]SOD19166.1 hypothetical protein SAMN06297164_2137 [Nitrosomonas ureae]